jgi:hypothetical protein
VRPSRPRRRALLPLALVVLAGCAELTPPPETPVVTAPSPDTLDRTSGTLSVGSETTAIAFGYASRQRDASGGQEYLDASGGLEYLVVLLADRPVTVADRQPSRLAVLARSGQVRGLRIVWRSGFDDVTVALYHPHVAQSGLAFRDQSVLSLDALSADHVAGNVRSKSLGQGWAFAVAFDGALPQGGLVELEPAAASVAVGPVAVPSGGAPAGPVATLARRGHEFTSDEMIHSMVTGDLESVRLFLRGGMSPDVKSAEGDSALMLAIGLCTRAPTDAHNAIVLALIEAKANVHVRDGNNSTPPIWAADKCGPKVIQALVDAGADVNARAKGGATPLMMAEVTGQTENAAILRKAGAAPWR